MNLRFYFIASLVKLFLWLFMVFITYTSINIYEDPGIWIGLWFVGTFIFVWWFSFFLFLWWQKIFRNAENERIVKDSYKLSLLFGIYSVINILLLMLGNWNRFLWFILLFGFILIHVFLLENKSKIQDE